jgi:hypothetical protein
MKRIQGITLVIFFRLLLLGVAKASPRCIYPKHTNKLEASEESLELSRINGKWNLAAQSDGHALCKPLSLAYQNSQVLFTVDGYPTMKMVPSNEHNTLLKLPIQSGSLQILVIAFDFDAGWLLVADKCQDQIRLYSKGTLDNAVLTELNKKYSLNIRSVCQQVESSRDQPKAHRQAVNQANKTAEANMNGRLCGAPEIKRSTVEDIAQDVCSKPRPIDIGNFTHAKCVYRAKDIETLITITGKDVIVLTQNITTVTENYDTNTAIYKEMTLPKCSARVEEFNDTWNYTVMSLASLSPTTLPTRPTTARRTSLRPSPPSH